MQQTQVVEPQGATRRAFHLAVVYVLGAIIGIAKAEPTILYLLIPPKSRKQLGFIDAGDVSQLTPGVPVEMSFEESRLDGWKLSTEKKTAWVVKEANNQVVAFGPQCTHLGCAYHWEMEQGTPVVNHKLGRTLSAMESRQLSRARAKFTWRLKPRTRGKHLTQR